MHGQLAERRRPTEMETRALKCPLKMSTSHLQRFKASSLRRPYRPSTKSLPILHTVFAHQLTQSQLRMNMMRTVKACAYVTLSAMSQEEMMRKASETTACVEAVL